MKKIANKHAFQRRTLALGRETIRHLAGEQLALAAGGIPTDTGPTFGCTQTCNTRCACPITRTIQCDSNGIACTSNCTLSNA